jgi:hypothetical protein
MLEAEKKRLSVSDRETVVRATLEQLVCGHLEALISADRGGGCGVD